MQLIVTTKLLNKRKVVPGSLPEPTGIVGQVKEGYRFEAVEADISEVPNAALGKWYKDRDGYFYWGGGVTEFNLTQKPNSYFFQLKELINWNDKVPQIPAEWKKTKGAGVKIAIIDTGVLETHEDLKGAIWYYQDFTDIKDKIDYDGHGTHVSGIVGARSFAINGVIGVAPLADLIILKVLPDDKDGGGLENYQSIIDALTEAVRQEVDIINLSFSLKEGSDPDENEKLKVNELKNKIEEISKNVIITAAAGDNASLRDQALFFPSNCNGVISIASIKEGYFDRNPDFSNKLNIVGPTINYTSIFKSPIFYERYGGCSMTTAFITGITALIISANRTDNSVRFSKSEILSFLNDYSQVLSQINYNDQSNFYYHILNQA